MQSDCTKSFNYLIYSYVQRYIYLQWEKSQPSRGWANRGVRRLSLNYSAAEEDVVAIEGSGLTRGNGGEGVVELNV